MIVVADAGPLLHLHWVGAATWALPPRDICVVDEVWTEVARHAADALQDSRLVRVRAPTERPTALPHGLDQGETAAIAFALTKAPALVLCDELAAREACVGLGLAVTGSVGLVLGAVREARIGADRAAQALADLPTKGGLHASRDLIERALRSLQRA